jgi:hypothetical protein
MSLRRLLGIALALILVMRLVPWLAPAIWPGLRRKVDGLRRRLDLASAAIMLGFAVSMALRREPVAAAVVLVLGIPAFVAAAAVVRDWWRKP